ncbi:MAG: hypothetical protein DDT28_01182 [Dehalococcoidia bacterium]|nr:hypothetical protein [Chloroflexota bacterium]
MLIGDNHISDAASQEEELSGERADHLGFVRVPGYIEGGAADATDLNIVVEIIGSQIVDRCICRSGIVSDIQDHRLGPVYPSPTDVDQGGVGNGGGIAKAHNLSNIAGLHNQEVQHSGMQVLDLKI